MKGMTKGKNRVVAIPLDVFRCSVVVVSGDWDWLVSRNKAMRFGIDIGERSDWDGYEGACFQAGAGDCVVWLKSDETPVAVHEFVHAAKKTLDHRGIDDEECLAYVVERLVGRYLATRPSGPSRQRSSACAKRRSPSSRSDRSRPSAQPSPAPSLVSSSALQPPPFGEHYSKARRAGARLTNKENNNEDD